MFFPYRFLSLMEYCWRAIFLFVYIFQLTAALTTFPFFTFALAGCLQSFHPTHAQLSNRNGKFIFSGTFHIMWVKVGQGILLNRIIFLNKSDQLCINIT